MGEKTMLYNAKNGTLRIGETEMDYIHFGKGDRILIMLPGLGDGLQTVKGSALPMAILYREFCKNFSVYAFSRKNGLPETYTTRDMARDQAKAMDELGIRQASIFGVSMGGMIAQWLAIDYPEKVEKLILTVTCAKPNPILTESIQEWISFAKAGDHNAFMDSNVRRIYSEKYYRKNRWMVPVMGLLTKPKTYDRFYVQANACLSHNAWEHLHQIKARTFVVGGERDQALGGDPSREIAEKIPNAELRMYEHWGHGVYEEEKNFNQTIIAFLRR